MKIARAQDGKIREIRSDFKDAAEAQKQAPLPAKFGRWVEVPDNVKDNWDYDGRTATEPVEPAADKIKRLRDLADHIAREKIKVATSAPESDFEALRVQVAMIAKAVLLSYKEQQGRADPAQQAVLEQLEKIGDEQVRIEEVRESIKQGITSATTEQDIISNKW